MNKINIKNRGGKAMAIKALNKKRIVKKRMLKVRRFQSDRNLKVKVCLKSVNLHSLAGENLRVLITV